MEESLTGYVDHFQYIVFKFPEIFTGDDDAPRATEVLRGVNLNAFARPTQLLVCNLIAREPDGTVALTPVSYLTWGYRMAPIGDGPAAPA